MTLLIIIFIHEVGLRVLRSVSIYVQLNLLYSDTNGTDGYKQVSRIKKRVLISGEVLYTFPYGWDRS